MPKPFPYYPPGSPERIEAENRKNRQLAEVSSQRQDMANRAQYRNRVFDQQSGDIARQKNKEKTID
jgi:hypothetical protein